MKLLNILSEQVLPMYRYERYVSDNLTKGIESIMVQTLNRLRLESEEMGLGEMDYINEIDSVESVKVTEFYKHPYGGTNVLLVDINANGLTRPSTNFHYYLTREEIERDINKILPKTEIRFTIENVGGL